MTNTPREDFRSNYEAGTAYKVDGALLNKQGEVLKGVAMRSGAAFADTTYGQPNIPPAAIVGVATITDAGSNGCGGDEESDAPCALNDLYLARFRYYDTQVNEWAEYEEDLRLDASGYWEGLLRDGDYETSASVSPTSGPGYGAIPAFAKGDQVPAYYDSNRGWLVPIISPPADSPGGEAATTTIQQIPDVSTRHSAVFSLDIKEPDGDWTVVQQMAIRLPEVAEKGFFLDSGSMTAIFAAVSEDTGSGLPIGNSTQYRVRMGKSSGNDVYLMEARLKVFMIGRKPAANFVKAYSPRKWMPDSQGQVINQGWDVRKSVTGRFKDSAAFVLEPDGDQYVYHQDPTDASIIKAELDVIISGDPIFDSELSESDLSESDLSESDLSESGHDQYCQVEVVSDILCNEDGTIEEVCYRTILIPKIGGLSCGQQIGAENCVPCTVETSSSSQSTGGTGTSSASSTSSTNALTTSSSGSSSSSEVLTSSQSTSLSSTLSFSTPSSNTRNSFDSFDSNSTATIQDTIAQPPF